MRKTSKFTLFISVLIVLSFCVTAGTTAWLGVEKARLAYDVSEYRKKYKKASEFFSKLDTERDLLLSPSRLRQFAEKEGLSQARSGQVRKIIIKIPAEKE